MINCIKCNKDAEEVNINTGICYACKPPSRPSRNRIDAVYGRMGTDENRATLKKDIDFYNKYAKVKIDYKGNVIVKNSLKPSNFKPISNLKKANDLIKSKRDNLDQSVNNFYPKVTKRRRPDKITYEVARKVFDLIFATMVYNKNQIVVDGVQPSQDKFVKEFIKYLIYDKSGIPLNQSLCVIGKVGIGKSTIVKAGIEMLKYFNSVAKWGDSYNIFEMPKLQSLCKTRQKLIIIEELFSKNALIDDVRPEDFKFNFYGNEISIPDIFEAPRFIGWENKGTRTIITTNMNEDEFIGSFNKFNQTRILQEYFFTEISGENKR